MSENLLTNPGFEGGWTRATKFWVPDQDGNLTPNTTEFGEIFTPEGWVSWWVENAQNSNSPADQLTGRPEIQVFQASVDAVRVRSGTHSAKLFTFWRNQRCGLFQVVTGITPGARLQFSAYGHAWYSDCDNRPHDPPYLEDCSTLASDSHLYLRVGISPGGYQGFLAPDMVWSHEVGGVEQYGGYGDPCTVEAVATGDTVTVWLRSNSNYALKHVDVYWDDCLLEVIEEPPPEPEPCRGTPRIQYEAHRVLVPADLSRQEAAWVTLNYPHVTVTENADEAGIGDLDVLRVTVLNADRWGGAAGLADFFAVHYPQAQVEFVYYPGQPEPPSPEPPPEFNPRVLTLHLQQDVEAAQRFVSTCKPAAIKRVLGAQDLPTYAVLNPGMRCVYRGMGENEDPVAFVDMHIGTLHQVADMFEERDLPLIDGKLFWWELWNEVYGYDREPNIIWRDREIAATLELAQREPRVGVVAFNAGVGNIHPPNFDVLVPLARVVADNNGMFGLHSYFGATPTSCSIDKYEDEGRWLESRWEMTDDYLVEHGVEVNWFLSEGGAIYYQPPTNMPSSAAGWKYPECMNGDWPRYLGKLEQLAQRFYQQNLMRGGRLKGYSVFTEGGWDWPYFELGSAEIDAIAAMQVRIWPVTA